MSAASDPKPLGGRLVLDLSQGIAGPYCGMLLAEQGARVIKVEPPRGDWMRALGAGVGGVSASSLYYNRGKESLLLDLKTPRALAAALSLAARADVLIESARPGAMAKLGLGFEAVRALNPGVVYLSISGYGLSGPKASWPLSDTYAQAFSGLMSINRADDGAPRKLQTPVIDAVTGLYAVQAAMAALWPAPGGAPRPARHLDISLIQAAAALQAPKIMEAALSDGRAAPALNAPAGIYRAADGWMAITLVTEPHWAALRGALGLDALAGDPRFADFAARAANLDTLRDKVAARLATRAVADWTAELTALGIMAGPVNDHAAWLADPQVRATEAAPETGIMGAAPPVARTPGRAAFAAPPPGLGADTARLAREFHLDIDIDIDMEGP
ncbi:CoA transferase [Pikeienuella sp. HZG-20]|uniref:CaiB/BaiF CoA transferase family protein n=1 Tax=Paludibacillus litoralis TaxID=3133267 RepID=UPI0030EDB924